MKSTVLIAVVVLFAACLHSAELLPHQKFTIKVEDQYKNQVLHFLVPEEYGAKSLPLIVLLHGGGPGTRPGHPLHYLEDDEKMWGGLLNRGEAVVVAPYMLESEKNSTAWNNDRVVEEYLANVVLEAHERFKIDPERVILMGWSMGGYGAYHIAEAYPDRFSAIIAGAGGWGQGDWRNSLTGAVPVILVHGEKDAVYKKRPHFTDIQEALTGFASMKKVGANAHLLTTPGAGHSPSEQVEQVHRAWEIAKKTRRNLRRIFLSTPIGGIDKPDRGWISIDRVSPGKISVEQQRVIAGKRGGWQEWDFSEEEFNAFKLRVFPKQIEGGWVDAAYSGENRFDLETKNIGAVTVRMNHRMVNYDQPVVIHVNGKKMFEGKVVPDPKFAEEEFRRRKDLGMLYDGRVSLALERED